MNNKVAAKVEQSWLKFFIEQLPPHAIADLTDMAIKKIVNTSHVGEQDITFGHITTGQWYEVGAFWRSAILFEVFIAGVTVHAIKGFFKHAGLEEEKELFIKVIKLYSSAPVTGMIKQILLQMYEITPPTTDYDAKAAGKLERHIIDCITVDQLGGLQA